MRSWVAVCTAFLLLVGTANRLAAEVAFDERSAETLFKTRCSSCHHPDRALKKRKDRAGWEKTVSRMKGYAAGLIAEEEAPILVEYLTRVRAVRP